MIKKIIILAVIFFCIWFAYAQDSVPGINSFWLPFDNAQEWWQPGQYTNNDEFILGANKFLTYAIQIVAVIAVISLMLSGIMLIASWWEEEKFKKARVWFTWSLIGVVITLTAWYIINFINNLSVWW